MTWEPLIRDYLNVGLPWAGIVSGVIIIGWALFADRAYGRRRCPKCWYDMSSIPALICPECGKGSRNERHLARTRRRWRVTAFAIVQIAVAIGALSWPRLRHWNWYADLPDVAVMWGAKFTNDVDTPIWREFFNREEELAERYSTDFESIVIDRLRRAQSADLRRWLLTALCYARPFEDEALILELATTELVKDPPECEIHGLWLLRRLPLAVQKQGLEAMLEATRLEAQNSNWQTAFKVESVKYFEQFAASDERALMAIGEYLPTASGRFPGAQAMAALDALARLGTHARPLLDRVRTIRTIQGPSFHGDVDARAHLATLLIEGTSGDRESVLIGMLQGGHLGHRPFALQALAADPPSDASVKAMTSALGDSWIRMHAAQTLLRWNRSRAEVEAALTVEITESAGSGSRIEEVANLAHRHRLRLSALEHFIAAVQSDPDGVHPSVLQALARIERLRAAPASQAAALENLDD